MTRRHGRSPRGIRLIAKLPHGRWRTLTFLAALRCDRIAAPCVIDGPINGTSFRAYVEAAVIILCGIADRHHAVSGVPSSRADRPRLDRRISRLRDP